MQTDTTPRNRSERVRKRAWRELQHGHLSRYNTLVKLALEAHTIR